MKTVSLRGRSFFGEATDFVFTRLEHAVPDAPRTTYATRVIAADPLMNILRELQSLADSGGSDEIGFRLLLEGVT